MYKCIQTILFIIISTLSFSQTIIKGKVIDAISRQPLEAAYIQQTGNENAKALTDRYGNFQLKINDKQADLAISFIGYKSASVQLSGTKEMKIELEPDVVNLKDISISKNIGQQKFSTLARVDLDLKPVRNTQQLMRIVPGLFVA